MNESAPLRQRAAHRGADCEWIRSLLSLAPRLVHTSANRETRSGWKKKKVWKVEQASESWGGTFGLGQYTTCWTLTTQQLEEKTTHTQQVQAEWSPRELTGSDHNPLPPLPRPPLREGHHSGPDGSANSDPEPQLAPHPPLLPGILSTSFLLCSLLLRLFAFCPPPHPHPFFLS